LIRFSGKNGNNES